MTRALLGADYRDIGRSHTVEVLEELRDGFLRKSEQMLVAAKEASNEPVTALAHKMFAKGLLTAVDDIAWRIQREQVKS